MSVTAGLCSVICIQMKESRNSWQTLVGRVSFTLKIPTPPPGFVASRGISCYDLIASRPSKLFSITLCYSYIVNFRRCFYFYFLCSTFLREYSKHSTRNLPRASCKLAKSNGQAWCSLLARQKTAVEMWGFTTNEREWKQARHKGRLSYLRRPNLG